MRLLIVLLTILTFKSEITASNKVCILIHGTWAADANWHKPGGLFYETLKEKFAKQKTKLINFNWSGILSYEKRQLAGQRLANLIDSYPSTTTFALVTHSHGGNVGIVASQLLKEKNKIEVFYALGTPIDEDNYTPNMNVINNFYNIFSFGDTYQTVLGFHNRIFSNHPRICNINCAIKGKKPQHENLHCESIAIWLPKIHKLTDHLDHNKHLFADFFNHISPTIKVDEDINKKMAADMKLHELMCLHMLGSYSDSRASSASSK